MDPGIEGLELGHYRVVRLLGSGGMGEVYLATDLLLGRDVAIKLVTGSHGDGGPLARRLLQEAKAVATLDHPCICPVHDVGVDPTGRPYMVMQLVPGETLASRLKRGPLPVRDALLLASRIADALALAHSKGIIHRDLKPQNIMVTPTGEPRLLDFGIAKLLPSPLASTLGETATALTGPYALVGTPAYMSPEQVRQQPVDGRSDLFALGAILFETLTGRRAFTGRQTTEVLGDILHVHPPAVSSLRPDVDGRHDELCRRLLAKEPADRFQSAGEVVGALRVLLPDSSVTPRPDVPAHVPSLRWRALRDDFARRRWARSVLAIGILALIAAALGARWPQFSSTPRVPADAARWFARGTEALRDGTYHSAAIALEEGLRIYPPSPIAYARLAEARAAIDDEGAAQQALVRLSQHAPDQTRLPPDDRVRVEGVRALVLGNVDGAIRAYRDLASRHQDDPGLWLDLGRAQERGALLRDANDSYHRALTLDRQYAAAYLHIGVVAAAEGRRQEALDAFAEAERLYHAASNTEGETEVQIRRGALFDVSGDFAQARAALERATTLARSIDSTFHLVRAQMHLSSVTASEGQYAEAERLASTAVQAALDAGLETVAADGLIDVAITILTSRPVQADALLQKAGALADKRGARRVSARAASQRASLQLEQDHADQALLTLAPALAFFKQHQYRKYELPALSIAARAYQRQDNIAQARALTTEGLRVAEAMRDIRQIGTVLVNLAGQAAVLGSLPEALGYRERAEQIHRAQQEVALLPFDLTNRADILIQLGRSVDADVALREVEEGIAKGVPAFVERLRRATYLRLFDAVVQQRYQDAVRVGRTLAPDPAGTDAAAVLGPLLLSCAQIHLQQRGSPLPARPPRAPPLTPALERERRYWETTVRLAAGTPAEALTVAKAMAEQAERLGNDELVWRMAAVGSAAAGALSQDDDRRALQAKASGALNRLRAAWGPAARSYESRPDLTQLRKAAGI